MTQFAWAAQQGEDTSVLKLCTSLRKAKERVDDGVRLMQLRVLSAASLPAGSRSFRCQYPMRRQWSRMALASSTSLLSRKRGGVCWLMVRNLRSATRSCPCSATVHMDSESASCNSAGPAGRRTAAAHCHKPKLHRAPALHWLLPHQVGAAW
eukprot:CAMPEP_0178376572 /NCGR_PEP_ID=MMETSP0689_2-20121128/3472_1 /TAXON_ID=160604 /ORGANISM="Amphidinium massartii, Strain CS-259" /LENGTH=151 /DNA_ID=CAMNT_0019996599 /DNA_START=138 /DNA_END=593 /DNA_ORIENTATION=+